MNNEIIKRVGRAVCKAAAIAIGMGITRGLQADCNVNREVNHDVGYYDAVRAIMSTSMFASDKRMCVDVMRKGECSGYYKAVIEIAQSSMFGSDKIDAIKSI